MKLKKKTLFTVFYLALGKKWKQKESKFIYYVEAFSFQQTTHVF